ncbi:S9 family peptidase [Kocuria rhizophila]|uniref:S9 family peptidase n=1 Tax=Kocuria rhizophila TaxID=72000 RepID=UPI0022F0B6D7|nr:prolyl oligopeptidase family serine peptidase [Kocuria rhizophila]MDA4829576.1 prolyl oligopeptidase family serine peptidase [Kocuria rhizophila]WSY88601.1 prolyl oligopeptidase family serine peptidase [Kocuria rhizophila]WSZ54029.1 prolyl oligopeptidase family serine peptidase [Kocuria rhizophila]
MTSEQQTFPVAPRRPVERTFHGHTFADPYEWLREKDSPEVRAHLDAENTYAEAVTADLAPLRESIYTEIKDRTQETDLSVPSRHGDWWYFARTVEGGAHQVFCRVPVADPADWTPPAVEPGTPLDGEQTLLDANAASQEHEFYALGAFSVAEDGSRLAWSEDIAGDERFTVYVKDLTTGELLADRIPQTSYGAFLTPDAAQVVYTVVDESWRPYRVYRHVIGTDVAQDQLLFQEDDPGLWLGAELSADKQWLMLSSSCSEYSEYRILRLAELPADDAAVPGSHGQSAGAAPSTAHRDAPDECTGTAPGHGDGTKKARAETPADLPWRVVLSRDERVLYEVEPLTVAGTDVLLLSHDAHAPNGRISLMPLEHAGWSLTEVDLVDVVPASDTVRVESGIPTATHLVVALRENTTPRVRLIPRTALEPLVAGAAHDGTGARAGGAASSSPDTDAAADAGLLAGTEAAFDEDLSSTGVLSAEYENPVVRVSYTSFVTPPRVYDIPTGEPGAGALDEFGVGEPVLRRETTVLGGYRSEDYTVERDWAVAEDGTRIPVSLVRRADLDPAVPAPVLQYAYGSYEISTDPAFSISRLSLLDRGVVWAVAHVRGGGELGRAWYENGKKNTKTNTFTDFVAVTRHLAARPDVDARRIALMGGSAGGLLAGAVLNLAPELYCGGLAAVPFVDALTSMLMPELPLTALEWEEWGNPVESAEVYEYMRSYSPYENVRDADYPPILAVTSLNDTRVLYVEPAKWVAELRTRVAHPETVLLRCEMAGGHGGASGRYAQWKDTAWEYAWLAWQLGVAD